MIIDCSRCNHDNEFEQPYRYHAGFGDQGFLYNDAGTLTLVWSSYDPAYVAIVGKVHPWGLGPSAQALLESALLPAPSGGQWRFGNPARCTACGAEIGQPMLEWNIHYLVYPGSLILDKGPEHHQFHRALRTDPSRA